MATRRTGKVLLKDLLKVNWKEFRYEHDRARPQVPKLLRTIRDETGEEQDNAIDELYRVLLYYGRRFPGTVAAIPFIFELVEDPGTAARGAILRVLISLAAGMSNSVDYSSPDEWIDTGCSRALLRLAFEARVRAGEQTPADMESGIATYDAIAQRIPSLASLVRSTDENERRWASFVAPWFLDEHEPFTAAMRKQWSKEPVADIKAAQILSLSYVAPLSERELKPYLSSGDANLRMAAAFSLVRTRSSALQEGLDVLRDFAKQEDAIPTDEHRTVVEAHDWYPWAMLNSFWRPLLISHDEALLNAEFERLKPRYQKRLRAKYPRYMLALAFLAQPGHALAIRAAMDDLISPAAIDSKFRYELQRNGGWTGGLTPLQRRALTTLASFDEAWLEGSNNYMGTILSEWGFPNSQAALLEFLASHPAKHSPS
ncbi:hypothetical protein LZC95_14450 [Pendulispora brunnea]|uniref:Uncharacterized protein n=1 Tax=Pendulispora brunnea TaxID=2905690 RepID=A0ABZ2KH75_9BACT